MLSNAKKITIASLFAGLAISLCVAFGSSDAFGGVKAASQITGNHYTERSATFSESGCKEYWIDCLTKNIYFNQPLEGNWHDNGVANVILDANDPRYIAPIVEEEIPNNEDIKDVRINKEETIVEDINNENTGLIISDENGNVGTDVNPDDDTQYNVISYQGDNKTVVIPEGVVTLDTYNASGSAQWNGNPFDGSNESSNAAIVETVIIPSTVKYLHVGAFKNMKNLKTVVIGAQEIYYGAFSNCPNIKNVYIKNSCKVIHQGAFIESYSTNMTISAEATSKPAGWQDNWSIRAWTYPVSLYEVTFGVAY